MKKIVYAALAAIGVFVVLIFIVQLSGEMESSMSNENRSSICTPNKRKRCLSGWITTGN